MSNRICDIDVDTPSLWDGQHKIPWNDAAFSARILREHLSQDHHLASRKKYVVHAQAAWIRSRFLCGDTASILDLGCGPGLYATPLAGNEHDYLGIDFSPASIEYAIERHAENAWHEFVLGDVVEADYGGPHNLAMMLFGEINVFPPSACRRIMEKAARSLVTGGSLILEAQRFETVKTIGQGPDAKTEAEAGLFSDSPYVCLTSNRWYPGEAVSQQVFTVRAENEADTKTYKSTTKAWKEEELRVLLHEAGFGSVSIHDDWPDPDDAFILLTAVKR